MKLTDVTSGSASVPISALSGDRELSSGIQQQLSRLGILDPPADGDFGPASQLAWRKFASLTSPADGNSLTPDLARMLLDSTPEALLPVNLGTSLADAIWQAALNKGYWLTRVPGWVNIVYIEGANPDGSANDNRPNSFNDLRTVLTVEDGRVKLLGKWEATTEPGKFFTDNPINPRGAARIAFDQFKAWCVGTHQAGTPGAHEALVQRGVIRVFRDMNRDSLRTGDAVDTGADFGVNQHWGYDMRVDNVGNASAGCLVGRTRDGHREFMQIVKADPRFLANNAYKFMTAILPSADLTPFVTTTAVT